MMMMHQKEATEKEAVAKTWVVWDINSCPVPSGCNASRVGLCIRRALKNLGYFGDVTITAIGILTDVPDNLLQSVSSTGIDLCHTRSEKTGVALAMLYSDEFPPPTNIQLISAQDFESTLNNLEDDGYNILPQVFYDYNRNVGATSTEVKSFWKSFLKDTMDSEEKCSETSECEWTCKVCRLDDFKYYTVGQGFESFTNHLLSEEHHQKMLCFLAPSKHKSYEEKAKAYRDSHPKNATISVNKEPKRKCQRKRQKGKCKKQENRLPVPVRVPNWSHAGSFTSPKTICSGTCT